MRPDNIFRCVPPLWALLLLSLLLWGGEFARRSLWEPDEARYGCVAREMHDSGHWFVPHIHGQPYPDKPPLMFWLINAASVFTGGEINSVSTRMPSLLGVILTLWAMTRLLAHWHSCEAAWRSVPVLMTSFLFWQEGGYGRIDALLCGLVMMSLYFFFTGGEPTSNWRYACAYLFAGLATLAKGPVGLAVPMGVYAVGAWAAGDGQTLKRSHWLWGPVLALCIPGIWLLTAYLQDPPSGYFAAMFGEKSFGRVTTSIGHDRPFYYFVWHFIVEFLPWTVLLPAAFHCLSDQALRRRLMAWGVFVIGFFSLFVCKRNIYILAAYPAAAMLIGAAWSDVQRLSPRWTAFSAWMATAVLAFIGFVAAVAVFVPQVPFNRLTLLPSAAVVLAGTAWLICIFRHERLSARWFFVFSGTVLLNQALIGAVVMPALNQFKAPTNVGIAIREHLGPDQPVYLFRQQLAILPLYADRPGRVLESVQEVDAMLRNEDNGVLVCHESEWEEIRNRFSGKRIQVHIFKMGHKDLVWVWFEADGKLPLPTRTSE